MKLKAYFIACSLTMGWLVSLAADETPLEKLLKQIAKLTETYPQEKVHLHVDKPYYAIGEDIWIKAYVVTAAQNEPSSLSGILYVELINNKNEIRKKIRLTIDRGTSFGNINLLDSVSAGTYRLRAYTNYMRNYGNDFFFEKTIQIGDAFEGTKSGSVAAEKTGIDAQFFPEGGYLVNGIRSKVGVKVIGKNGLGLNLSGYISNQNNDKVAIFETEHAGLGVFALVPKAGDKYTATVTLSTGGTTKVDLPIALGSGFVMSINEIDTSINLKINSTPDLKNGQELHVIAQNNGLVYGSYSIAFNREIMSINIPKSTFPTGILQFTLFNASNEPLAERLVFVNHHDQLNMSVTLKDSLTKALEKVELNLKINNVRGLPVVGNFSVAVVDAGKVAFNEDDEITIQSNLLLTSDLKGYIEQPNYYFNNPTEEKNRQLNNLMLTQGWRRFVWKDVINNKEPEIKNRIEQTLEIKGTIVNLNDKPVENAKVMLFSNHKDYPMIMEVISDANGKFVFDELKFPDSIPIYLQAKTSKDNPNLKIKLDNGPDPKTGIDINQQKTLILKNGNAAIGNYLESTKAYFDELDKYNPSDKSIRLKTVNIISSKNTNPFKSPIEGSQNMSGSDYVIGQDILKNYTNLVDVFYRTPGVMFSKGKVARARDGREMIVYINGSPTTQDALATLNANDVEGIEVLTSNYNFSVYGVSSGILHITLKKGKDVKYPTTNTLFLKNEGLALKKEFYSPNYDDPKINKATDLRSTIYWNANINTNQTGAAKLSYFNALTTGTYKVTIEGIDTLGNLGRKTYTYVVK
jgi:hypothetical protein